MFDRLRSLDEKLSIGQAYGFTAVGLAIVITLHVLMGW